MAESRYDPESIGPQRSFFIYSILVGCLLPGLGEEGYREGRLHGGRGTEQKREEGFGWQDGENGLLTEDEVSPSTWR